jgi:hypothetical protein
MIKLKIILNIMNVDNIPRNVKQIMQDKELSIHKKMVAFMAFMPRLPSDPKNDQAWKDNEKIGEQISTLINDGKIRIGKFNKDFMLDIIET